MEDFMFTSFNSNSVASAVVVALLMLWLGVSSPAQSIARPERGDNTSATYEETNVDRVDLRNGNLSLAIPLASLPKMSGGKLGYTLVAYYNSKLWDSSLREEFRPGAPDSEESGPPVFYVAEVPRPSLVGGWRVGEKYEIRSEIASDDFVRSSIHSSATDPDYAEINNHLWHKTVLIAPDGARHELRPFGLPTFQGSSDFYRGYYKDSPTLVGRPIDYYSFDGTFLRVRIFPNGDDLAWRILQPDGVMIEGFQDGRQRISDTNGNAILIFDESETRVFREERTGREIILRRTAPEVWDVFYRTVGGGHANVRIHFNQFSVSKLFGIDIPSSDGEPNGGCTIHERVSADFRGIALIELPQTEAGVPAPRYRFTYNHGSPVLVSYLPGCSAVEPAYADISEGAGELKSMISPTGVHHRYRYHLDGWTKTGENENTVIAANTLSHRAVQDKESLVEWTYSFGIDNSAITSPDGTVSLIERYPSSLTSHGDDSSGMSGLVYRETTGNLLMIERRWKRLVFSGANDRTAGRLLVFNPVVAEEYKTVYSSTGNPAKTSATFFEHDFNGNVLSTTVYDWFDTELLERDSFGIPLGLPENAKAISQTEWEYHHSPTASDVHSVYHSNPSRILSSISRIASGRLIEEFAYDGADYSLPPEQGNITAKRAWLDTDSAWLEERFEYDELGNLVIRVNPAGLITNYAYEDEARASPTTVTRTKAGAAIVFSESFTFDHHTGLVRSATDANGNISHVDYHNPLLGASDPHGRPGTEFKPTVTVRGQRMTHGTYHLYEDSLNRITTHSDVGIQGDRGRKLRHTKDGLGRTVLLERNENGSDQFSIAARVAYSADGRVVFSENPRRTGEKAPTDGWTRITSDALGRTTSISSFSGGRIPDLKATNTGWSGDLRYVYEGDMVTIFDQEEKWTRRHTDPTGRLVRVDEPSTELISDENTNATQYEYDSSGNLVRIIQGSQTREFVYDSLSRLISESSPESATSAYRYDEIGNRIEKVDASGTRTAYKYDGFGRLSKVTYAHGHMIAPTSEVDYRYDDPAVPNSFGRLTAVTSRHGSRHITGYDETGRLLGETLSIGLTEFPLQYRYALGGNLISTLLPSGRSIDTEIDGAGETRTLSTLRGNDSRRMELATSIGFHPNGALARFRHGNSLWEDHQLNARLQPTVLSVGRTEESPALFKIENHFTNADRSRKRTNNGNIHRQTISDSHGEVTHRLEYDSLNRIVAFRQEKMGRADHGETFTYDRNGNPRVQEKPKGFEGSSSSGTFNQEGVRARSDEIRDIVGNLVSFGEGGSNIFDAENRLVESRLADGSRIATYDYDGEGRRVSKTVFVNDQPWSKTVFIHDAAGRAVAEYSTRPSSEFRNRRLFLTSDHVGSVRLVTDMNGSIISRHDYNPFGKETTNRRDTSDMTRFAGHEKDEETGYFHAEARTLSPSSQRFLSADPITIKPDRLQDPQRLNRFSYVRNSPLRFSDPTGEDLHIKITNIVVGYQYLVDVSSGKRVRTEVMSYRVIVTNDSGTRRIFELTRGSSHGKRGDYGRLQEAPPGEYTGKVRRDGRRGFRIELTEPGQPDGQLTTPDSIRNRGNIQLHRNGLYVEGCMTFPVSDYERFEETITAMIQQDRLGGFGTKIFVSLIPRNARDGAGDLFPGDSGIDSTDMLGDRDGTASRTKAIFDRVVPASPKRLQ
jgi:RHS repeat-associated protein